MLELFAEVALHAILVSESWLKPELPSTTYSLPGFILIRNDRMGKRAGGVAIYLRSDIPHKVLLVSPPLYSGNPEYLFLEVAVKGVKAVLGVVYCPPSIDYFSSLESILESIASEYKHLIVMGDFNTDLMKQNLRSRKLSAILESTGLSSLELNPTHHNLDSCDSWLDLMLVASPPYVANHGQAVAPGLSRHDLIYLSYKIKPPKPQPVVVRIRNYSRLNREELLNDARSLDWLDIVEVSAVDEKVERLNSHIINVINSHAPLREVRIKRPPAPWISPGVRMAMRRRDRAFRRYRKDRTEENWLLYKQARNRCNQMIRVSKR
uniref:Endonuclease/exonuclease/phosphatase domain-containing protein n=1 Tax=Heliothis virescens TaxID=7102 RepID=A0A2A4K1J1_HELVI